MYHFIKGKIVATDVEGLVIENNGIGYRVFSSVQTLSQLQRGAEAEIFTQMIVRENDIFLVGFKTHGELSLFKLLTTVSGVGTKVALSVLSMADAANIAHAIVSGDSSILQKASGVGKKTAERIVLELKDRIAKMEKEEQLLAGAGLDMDFGLMASSSTKDAGGYAREAYEALVVLGYTKKEIDAAMRLVDLKDKPVEAIIVETLRHLGM